MVGLLVDNILSITEVTVTPEDAEGQYEQGLRALHLLRLAGRADTPEYERICDELDAPWSYLTIAGRERMRKLSSMLWEVPIP